MSYGLPPYTVSYLTLFIALQSCILADGFRSLAEGEDVEFEVTEDNNGRLRAVNVSGPDGAQPKVLFFHRLFHLFHSLLVCFQACLILFHLVEIHINLDSSV